MKTINLQDMPHEKVEVPKGEDVISGKTSIDKAHNHLYAVDENGNGEAFFAYSPNNPWIKHKHKIVNWVVQDAQSTCYPNCKTKYGSKGVPSHAHKIKKNVVLNLDTFENDSKTSSIYNGREKYKKLVNEGNQPIGKFNVDKTASLVNHMDLWYKRPFYGKYDYDLRLMRFNARRSISHDLDRGLSNVYVGTGPTAETDFKLIDFVTVAVENFFYQYNEQRPEHPESILNNIKIVKAYEASPDYSSYFFNPDDETGIYADFFYNYLQGIKDAKKIKNIFDFLDLFYVWASSNKVAVTEAGFHESRNYTVYNTGLAFDYMDIESEQQKQQILIDPRFPVLNYVAKINGLRIDPNYPARLIADINSIPMLDFAVSKYKTLLEENTPIEERPTEIFEKYFEPINFSKSSQKTILTFFAQIATIYHRFIRKYPTYSVYTADSSLSKNYKNQFKTSKVKRSGQSLSAFFNNYDEKAPILSKKAIRYYVKFRALETNSSLTKKQVDGLVDTIYALNVTAIKLIDLNLPELKDLLFVVARIRELINLVEEITVANTQATYAALHGITETDASNIFEEILEELGPLTTERAKLEKFVLQSAKFNQFLNTGSQAINYLEIFLKPLPIRNKKSKSGPKNNAGFVSFWGRGKGIFLTDLLDYYILEYSEAEEGRVFGELSPLAKKLLKQAQEDMAKMGLS